VLPDHRRAALARRLAGSAASLGTASAAIAILQGPVGVPNASSVYLVAVVSTAYIAGTAGAVAAAVASFLLYDFLFVAPVYTFTISDPGEWLNLLLLLFVGIVVGQLAAIQRSRTAVAEAREREARGLYRISRELATRPSLEAVLPAVVRFLAVEAGMTRAWVTLGPEDSRETRVADTDAGPAPVLPGFHQVLQRMPGEEPAHWVRLHQPPRARAVAAASAEAYRVRIEAGGQVLGSIWAVRDRAAGLPDTTETRLLSAAADQVGQTLLQERLAAESRAAEIARRSDELKSVLLQSVSHDLRTPLASIRAAAGTLRPGSGLDQAGLHLSADAIDREVEYLNRLVTNLLDMSRIEAGALRAEPDVFELDDLVRGTLRRFERRLEGRAVEVAVEPVPVSVDPVFIDEALSNILENALKYTVAGTPLRVVSGPADAGLVRLTVEDGGNGVPDAALPRLFDKFYRAPGAVGGSRSGTGIGLAVVRGMVEATGGTAAARRGSLGGLAIDLELPVARLPPSLAPAPAPASASTRAFVSTPPPPGPGGAG
jgi:two-component system sensor histidine kinase KdpD